MACCAGSWPRSPRPGYDFTVGLEIEFSIFKLDTAVPLTPENAGFTPPPPAVSVFERGYQFLSETRLDSMAPALDAMRDALAPLRPAAAVHGGRVGALDRSSSRSRRCSGLAAADTAVLFRSAVKQVCQRRGLLATFMCRPGLPNITSSGWHLHQSLAFRPSAATRSRQTTGRCRKSACPTSPGCSSTRVPSLLFAAPTVNGYKRYRPYSFAPDRVCLGVENRGALVRVQGSPGDASAHVEYAVGRARRQPVPVHGGQPRRRPGRREAGPDAAPGRRSRPVRGGGPVTLPTSLAAAVKALDDDGFYRAAFGDTLIDYLRA